jgi:hypothetical protein
MGVQISQNINAMEAQLLQPEWYIRMTDNSWLKYYKNEKTTDDE